MVSAVGPITRNAATDQPADALAIQAVDKLRQRHVDVSAVQSNAHETGRVLVDVDPQGKPTYTFSEHPAWDFIEWSEPIAAIAAQTQAVCFGTLAQRAPLSRATIQRFLDKVPSAALKVFDVNLRVDFWSDEVLRQSLAKANVLKLNDDELPIVARACGLAMTDRSAAEELRVLSQLQSVYGLQALALTRGSEGATLMTSQTIDHCPAPPTEIRDTVGAGDSYTAAMISGLLKGWPAPKINQLAVRVAGYVCSQTGATPELPAEIVESFM